MNVRITSKNPVSIHQFVAVKRRGMKDAWFMMSNCAYAASRIIKLYSRRWSIEPYFRDVKDIRFGFGLSFTHMQKPERRDRLLLMMSLSYMLLTMLGPAGEQLGLDKYLKVNTLKTRTHSLIRQGEYYFPNFNSQQQEQLLLQFDTLLQMQPQWQKLIFVC